MLSSADDFADVLAAGERGDGPQTLGYWAELVGHEQQARDLGSLHGAHGLAGDLNVDGSIGSRTARCGRLHRRARPRERLPDRRSRSATTSPPARWPACRPASTSSATRASDTVVEGCGRAADVVGDDRFRRARHRLEHLEMVDRRRHRSLVRPRRRGQRAARVRRRVGRHRRHVRRAAGRGARPRSTRSPTWPPRG